MCAPMPQQACWVVRKMLEARSLLTQVSLLLKPGRSLIRTIYLQLLGDMPRVPWTSMMFNDCTRPKSIFTVCLMLQGRLLSVDWLSSGGVDIDNTCVLCQQHEEDRNHISLLVNSLRDYVTEFLSGCRANQWELKNGSVTSNGYSRIQKINLELLNYLNWFILNVCIASWRKGTSESLSIQAKAWTVLLEKLLMFVTLEPLAELVGVQHLVVWVSLSGCSLTVRVCGMSYLIAGCVDKAMALVMFLVTKEKKEKYHHHYIFLQIWL